MYMLHAVIYSICLMYMSYVACCDIVSQPFVVLHMFVEIKALQGLCCIVI